MGCLDEGQLADFVEGRMSPGEEAGVKRHLEACEECRELVAEVARSVTAADAGAPLARGNAIGRYVVVDVVGVGGMGVVYAAYDPELDRKVAVKLLRRDVTMSGAVDTSAAGLGRRLLREAKSMARLSHPNVVAVYDAGTTADGRVFVAMEFVAGMSLGKWLEAAPVQVARAHSSPPSSLAPRPWREVLDVYALAGRGLAAAHEAGLVHRDFKPENVMIETRGDRVSRVLVTDFGLARPVSRESDSLPEHAAQAARTSSDAWRAADAPVGATLTRAGARVGTPAYMAPEQFRGESATALADQFSFCVALYEGLYGERPFAGASLEELEESVLSGRPRDVPSEGQIIPARIRAALLRGLSVDPGARFSGMSALLEALDLHAAQKRRRVVGGALVVACAALAALLGSRGDRKERPTCTGAEAKLAGVWDGARRAEIRAAFARTGAAYADDAWRGAEKAIDAYARGWTEMRTDACEATHVRGEQSPEMLDRRVDCLDAHLRQLGALTHLFAEADKEVVERAVEASLALPSLAECANAAALKAGVRPPSDPAAAARVQSARVHLARAKALEDAGKYADARAIVEPVIGEAREVGFLPLEASALALDGRVAGRLEDTTRAERSLREAAEAALAADDEATAARAFVDLVYFVGYKTARYEDARQWNRFARLAIERLGGNDELEADRLEALSVISWRQGKNEESLAALDKALALYQKVLGEDHVKVAHTLDGIAVANGAMGKIDEAYRLDAQALAIAERALGPNHPQVATYLNNEGDELAHEGRYAEALVALRRALDIGEKALGQDTPDLVAPLDTLAGVLISMERYDEALGHLRRAEKILLGFGRKDDPDYAAVLNDMGSVERARGRGAAALELHAVALALDERVLGGEHVDVATTLVRMAEAKMALGKPRDALADAERALRIVDKALGDASSTTADVLWAVGRARLLTGDAPGAVAALERAVKIHEAHPGDPRALADARFALAQALSAAGSDASRARSLAMDARATFQRAPWFAGRMAVVDAWLGAPR